MKNLEVFLEVEKTLINIMGGRTEDEVSFFLEDRFLEEEELAELQVGKKFVNHEPVSLSKRFTVLEAVETLYRNFLYAPKFGVTEDDDGDDFTAVFVVDSASHEILGKVEKKDFKFIQEQPRLRFTEVVETVDEATIKSGILPWVRI